MTWGTVVALDEHVRDLAPILDQSAVPLMLPADGNGGLHLSLLLATPRPAVAALAELAA